MLFLSYICIFIYPVLNAINVYRINQIPCPVKFHFKALIISNIPFALSNFIAAFMKKRIRKLTTKTPAGIRTIPMAKSVRKALLDEYADQSENGFNATVIDGINDFVFQVKEGYIGNSVNTNKAIHKICDSYNKAHNDAKVILPHFSCHQIRHTFCTRFCEHEDNLKVIQLIMGHSDITTTMNVYAEATKHRNKISIKSLEQAVDII